MYSPSKFTEHLLSSVKVENDNLQNTVDDLQQINLELSEEIDESKTNLSSESMLWNGEKEKLKNRLRDSELTLVMVADHKQQLTMQKDELAKQKAALEKKLIEEKKEMMDRQHGLEQMLKDVLEEKVEDDKENAKKRSPKKSIKGLALESMKSASPPAARPRSLSMPRPRQPLVPTDLSPPLAPLSPRRDSSAMRRRHAVDP